MNQIPLLTAADIDCRVQSVTNKQGKVGAILLLYKDARVDMKLLDEVFGVGNWQRTHEVINGNLFCNLDIWDETKKSWVRKQDVGTESNTEKEKGQASDAFKRAGFNVGIGRELYTSPFIYITLADGEYSDYQGKPRCSAWVKFSVQSIDYNERREISSLVIVDQNGKQRFALAGGKAKAALTVKTQQPAPPPELDPEIAPSTEPITKDHVKLLLNLAARKGYDAAKVRSHAMKRFHVEPQDMTKGQYGELLSGYNGLPDTEQKAG